jgi:hypothetical protein
MSSPAPAAKIAVAAVLIGGTFGVLWAVYRPSVPAPTPAPRTPPPPVLHRTHADLRVHGRTATIECDGSRRRATGFWAADATEACDALASTRAALLAGHSCRRLRAGRLRLVASGAFGRRAFHVVQQRGGCPDPDDWLAVNALVRPLVAPDQKLSPARSSDDP